MSERDIKDYYDKCQCEGRARFLALPVKFNLRRGIQQRFYLETGKEL
jgi:hypothetical protein